MTARPAERCQARTEGQGESAAHVLQRRLRTPRVAGADGPPGQDRLQPGQQSFDPDRRQRIIAGAALDVVDPEPLVANSPFYGMPNVILTPHSAYYSERSVDVVRRETLLEALQVLRGKRPRTVANPSVLSKVSLEP